MREIDRASALPLLRMVLLCRLELAVEAPHELGETPCGRRRVVLVSGGRFEGERLRGTILPGGADWITIRSDGVLVQDVRLLARTDDGATVGIAYRGMRHGTAQTMGRLERGERVDPNDYYFRTLPIFETADPRYAWLNRILCVGVGGRRAQGVSYDLYEIA